MTSRGRPGGRRGRAAGCRCGGPRGARWPGCAGRPGPPRARARSGRGTPPPSRTGGGGDAVDVRLQGMDGQEVHRLLALGVEAARRSSPWSPAAAPRATLRYASRVGNSWAIAVHDQHRRMVGGERGQDAHVALGQRVQLVGGDLLLRQDLLEVPRHLLGGLVEGGLACPPASPGRRAASAPAASPGGSPSSGGRGRRPG